MSQSDFIKGKKLTPKQKEILTRLNNGEEITYAKGGGYWMEDEQTNGKLVNILLKHCGISEDNSIGEKYRIYTINETGKMFLKTDYLWIHKGFTNSLMFK